MTELDPDIAAAFERLNAVDPPEFSLITTQMSTDSPRVATPVVSKGDINEIEPQTSDTAGSPPSTKLRFLAVAAAFVAVVVGAGALVAWFSPAPSVVASQEDSANESQSEPDELDELGVVRGPDEPLVVLGTSASPEDEARLVELCATEDFGVPFVEASAFLIEGFSFALGRNGIFGVEHCFEMPPNGHFQGPGGDGPQTNAVAGDPLEILSVNSISQGESTSEVLLVGRIEDGPVAVENVSVSTPPVELLGFERSGDWFVLWWEESTASHVFNLDQGYQLMLDTTFADGTTERIEWYADTRNDDCFEIACVESQLTQIADATTADPELARQSMALADGDLTQDEYDAAIDDFANCLADNLIREPDAGTVALQAESPDAQVASSCWRQHAAFVEEFRTWAWWRAFVTPFQDPTNELDEGAVEEQMETEIPIPPRELVPLDPADQLSASEALPTTFLFARGSTELFLSTDGNELAVASTAFGAEAPSFIESIVPIDDNQALIGVCCEPAFGNQQLLNIDNGTLERLGFNSSFPSLSPDGITVVSSGLTLIAQDLEPVLRQSDAVDRADAVVDLGQSDNGDFFRTAVLPNSTVAATDGDSIELIDLSGQLVASSSLEGVQAVVYDERNRVVIALVTTSPANNSASVLGDQIVLLHPETLEIIGEFDVDAQATSIDVHEGWILLAHPDGTITAQTTAGSEVVTVSSDGREAAWIPVDTESVVG